ncbi:MAG: hypothetical protein JRI46_10435 [Deltaproteobacteria bacterium]|nr:hypothetical protein [Deltaproteobacteria bacterium]
MTESKGAKSSKERYFWIVLSAILLALVFVLSFQYVRYKEGLQEAQKGEEALLKKLEALEGASLLRSWDVARLKNKGLSNPVEDLAADLMQHRELIPFEGVLGGTVGFYSKKDIHVLTSRWVLASFEDGHVGGRMLLEYRISPGGKISWKVLSAYLD